MSEEEDVVTFALTSDEVREILKQLLDAYTKGESVTLSGIELLKFGGVARFMLDNGHLVMQMRQIMELDDKLFDKLTELVDAVVEREQVSDDRLQ